MIKATNLIKTGIAWIPEIPSNWELKRIKLLFDFNKNIVGKTSSNYDVLSLTTKGVIKRDLESGMGKFPASFDGYQIIKPNSIMLCLFDMDVTPRVVGHVDDNGIISAAYTNIIPKQGINSKYYYYYFILQDKNKSLLALGTGIRITLNKDFFGTLKIPVPPLVVQNSIVAYLDKKNSEIDKFIKNKERLIGLLEEERKEMIDKIITTFDNVQTNIKPLKYLARLVSDLANKLSEGETYLALENIESWTGKIDLNIGDSEFESTVKKFKSTDVLFSKLRPYLAKVVIPDFKGVCVSEILVLRPSKIIDKEFLFYKLISRRIIDFIDSSTYGSKMPRASYDFIGKIEIEYPIDLDIQKKFVAEIKEKEFAIENLKKKFKKEIVSIKEYREALITDLVTGKRSIPE
jgi:type I restriction enzyme S subunit